MSIGKIEEKVCLEIQKMEEEMVQDLQRLVRIPSVVGQEAAVPGGVEGLYRSLGLDVRRLDPDIDRVREHPAFIDTGMPYQGRPNIIGILAGDSESRSLILNGHADVVSPDPVGAWEHDPWGAQIEGERMYGRGAGDMKAGLVANLFALKGILKAGLRPKGMVMLQSVIDEEAGGAGGTLWCLASGYTADAMICTEPHDLNITISHAGVNYFRVRVQGKSMHAGLAHLGVNAIGKMYLLYRALEELDQKRGVEVRFPLFEKGSGRSCHLNIGTMRAGDWPSNVPGEAQMECRISFVPGERMDEIKEVVETAVAQAAREDPWLQMHPPEVEWFGWSADPWYQDPGHPFVQMLKSAAEDVVGREVTFIGRASGIDSRFSQYFHMAAACTGPRAGNIHGIDEYVEISSITRVAQLLAVTVLRWCGYEE